MLQFFPYILHYVNPHPPFRCTLHVHKTVVLLTALITRAHAAEWCGPQFTYKWIPSDGLEEALIQPPSHTQTTSCWWSQHTSPLSVHSPFLDFIVMETVLFLCPFWGPQSWLLVQSPNWQEKKCVHFPKSKSDRSASAANVLTGRVCVKNHRIM